MKKTLLLVALPLLLAGAPLSVQAQAEVVKIGDLYYSISPDSDKAKVVKENEAGEAITYSGAVTLPSQVTYSGKTYTVTNFAGVFRNSEITDFTLGAGFDNKELFPQGQMIMFLGDEKLMRLNINSFFAVEDVAMGTRISAGEPTDCISVYVRNDSEGKGLLTVDKFEVYGPDGSKLKPCLINQNDLSLMQPDADNAFHLPAEIKPGDIDINNLEWGFMPLSSYHIVMLYAEYQGKYFGIRTQAEWSHTGLYIERDGIEYAITGNEAMVKCLTESKSGDITIPATVKADDGTEFPVTSVGPNAFSTSEVTGIKFPASVKYLYSSAIENCPKLKSVNLSECDGLNMSSWVFDDCPALKLLALPNECEYVCTIPDSPELFGMEVKSSDETAVTLRLTSGITYGTDRLSAPLMAKTNAANEHSYIASTSDGTVTIPKEDFYKNGVFDGKFMIGLTNVWWPGLKPDACMLYTFAIEESVFSGISEIGTDGADAPAEYYNMQGVRIDEPTAPGIYIRRQGAKASKTVVCGQ